MYCCSAIRRSTSNSENLVIDSDSTPSVPTAAVCPVILASSCRICSDMILMRLAVVRICGASAETYFD